jgi:ABC-type transporter Mla maintaining outer membrane lipid asymmetry ATPase subunit MlaF
MHFDLSGLMWVKGKYFEFSDIFYEYNGDLKIGIKYHIDSYAKTMSWFIGISLLYLSLIVFIEINNNIKGGSLANPRTWLKIVKESLRSMNLKRMNIKRLQIENMMNKYFEKFLKVDDTIHPGNCEPNTSFVIREDDISVNNEKKHVANLNKKRTIPSGIRIMSLGKTYKTDPVLVDINMEITKGEIVTILGPNGAGKSTLLNILTGQLASSTGYAKVGPFMIHNDLFIDANYLRRIIGVCSQHDYLWDELTVSEILHMYSRLRGISKSKIDEYVKDKLLSVNLDKKSDERVSSLSGGMKRRLSICISTLGEPFIIFMDEPTTGLDPNNRRKIWKLINVFILNIDNEKGQSYYYDNTLTGRG